MELFESLPANSSISHQDCGLQWQTFLTTFVPVTFLADKLMYSILTGWRRLSLTDFIKCFSHY